MKGLSQLLLLGVFATLLSAEVLDFGDLKKYENKGEAPEGVHPDSIWVTPAEGGFTIALGEELRKRMDGILGSCKEKDDKCFQDLNNALLDAPIQHDQRLESRFILITAAAVTTAWSVASAAIEGVVAALAVVGAAMAIKGSTGTFVPDEAASNAAKMPEATPITLSADGKAVATITKQPVPTEPVGEAASVTIVTQSSDGYNVNDLAVMLKDPAYLDLYMHNSINCTVGKKLDQEYPSRKRARAGSAGNAYCAAAAAMGGVRRGGPFQYMFELGRGGIHFDFRAAAGPVFEAANEFAEFVRVWAPMMNVPVDEAEQIGNFVFAMALDTIVEMRPLGEKNRINGESVTVTVDSDPEPTKTSDSKTSSTASGCPEPTDLICGYPDIEDCALEIQNRGKDDNVPVCKDTEHKGCECVAPGPSWVHIMPKEIYEAMMVLKEIPDKSEEKKDEPTCATDNTRLPKEVFSSEKSTVYDHFCEGWNKGRASKMTVNSLGENILPEIHLRKRVPPSKASDYNKYRFHLSYTPKQNAGDCTRDCMESFEDFTQFCSASAVAGYMLASGKFDAGCGTFEYKIKDAEIEELKENPPICYRTEDIRLPDDARVITGFYSTNIDSVCSKAGMPDWSVKKGDRSTFIHSEAGQQGILYKTDISWKEGCELDNGLNLISAANPLGKKGVDHDWTCGKILERAYSKCPGNGGRGGVIQVGCLMYETAVGELTR